MSRKMTKVFALAACLALGISVLTGCSGGSNSDTNNSGTSVTATDIDNKVLTMVLPHIQARRQMAVLIRI